jgi:diguanylate cyclase (GGDEF)-like protein/PAS domain S-box-containing protein
VVQPGTPDVDTHTMSSAPAPDLGADRERAPGIPSASDEIARIVAERDVTSLYQPIVDLRTGELVGCEILSRGPAGSPLHSAAALFGAAASAGLLSELDLVCRILGLSRAAAYDHAPPLVFVNVEPGGGHSMSMNTELLTVLEHSPFQVVVEFTERALTRQPAALLRYRDSVHERGNLVAIDDLGADPHSLALVPLIKPDILKLDIEVVHGTSAAAGVTAGAAWEYAARTGAIVVAEGIETEAHRQRALELGATWGQGFLFARPGPIDAIASMPRSRSFTTPWAGARRPSVGVEVSLKVGRNEPDRQPRQISRRMMLVLSQQLENAARRMGQHGVLLATIQTADVLSPRLVETYTAIAERAAFVGVLGVGVTSQPSRSVHGGDLAEDDPLAQQWSVAVVGPHFGAALVALPDPDVEDGFQAVWSQDPVYAADVAEQLARRLTTAPSRVEPSAIKPGSVGMQDLWPAIIEILRRPGVTAHAIGEDGIFVDPPEALAAIMPSERLTGRTALNAVHRDHRELVVATWMRARAAVGSGAGGLVQTIAGEDAWLHFVDVREDHGVYLGLLIPQVAEGATLDPGADPAKASVDPALPTAADQPRSGWLRKDEAAIILRADDEVCAMLGYSASDLEGIRTLELIHPDDRDQALTSWIDMLASPGMSRRARLRHRRADGRYLWCEVVNHNSLGDSTRGYVASELTDVHAEVLAQEELAHQQRILRTLAETLTTGVALVDAQGVVAYANQQMIAITGSVEGGGVRELLQVLHPTDQQRVRQAYRTAIAGEQPIRITVRLPEETGEEHRQFRLDISPSGDGGAVICAADITEEARRDEQLQWQATRDALTGCWNRSAILSLLAGAVEPGPGGHESGRIDAGRRLDTPVAVLYVDLDGFKQINDRYGHAAGDTMLQQSADRLRASVRDSDAIGRLGGDEFLLLCHDVPDAAAADQLADHVREVLAGHDALSASVGVAWTELPIDADALVARADVDMYVDKTQRRGRTPAGPRSVGPAVTGSIESILGRS